MLQNPYKQGRTAPSSPRLAIVGPLTGRANVETLLAGPVQVNEEQEKPMSKGTLLYAQSGGVTAVINCIIIDAEM